MKNKTFMVQWSKNQPRWPRLQTSNYYLFWTKVAIRIHYNNYQSCRLTTGTQAHLFFIFLHTAINISSEIMIIALVFAASQRAHDVVSTLNFGWKKIATSTTLYQRRPDVVLQALVQHQQIDVDSTFNYGWLDDVSMTT
jgi:hypothetical protein